MEDKDYLLLEYLSKFYEAIKIVEKDMPNEIRENFQFFGTDKNKYPSSIFVRLFELSKYGFVFSRYAGKYEITPLGREKLKKHQEQIAPKVFAEQCDTVLKYLVQTNPYEIITSQQLSEKLEIKIDTIEIIAEELQENELVKLSTDNGYYNLFRLPKADRFIRKTSFKEQQEKNMTDKSIQNSFNNTTYGTHSPIAGKDVQFNHTFNSINYEILASELATLKQVLLTKASSPEDYVAIGEIAKAEVATKNKEGNKVVAALQAAGKWVFDVAKETGASVVAEIIKNQMIGQ